MGRFDVVYRSIRIFTLLTLGLIITLVAIVLTALSTVIVRLLLSPTKFSGAIGSRFNPDDVTPKVIDRVFGVQRIQQLREDSFEIAYSVLDFEEELDQWGILREMENAQIETRSKIRDGELIIVVLISLFGIYSGLTNDLTLPVLVITGLGLTNDLTLPVLVITGLGVVLSVLNLLRIVSADILYYKPIRYATKPVDRLLVLRSMNIVTGKSQVVGALLLLSLLMRRNDAYEFGLGLFSEISMHYYGNGRRWRDEERPRNLVEISFDLLFQEKYIIGKDMMVQKQNDCRVYWKRNMSEVCEMKLITHTWIVVYYQLKRGQILKPDMTSTSGKWILHNRLLT